MTRLVAWLTGTLLLLVLVFAALMFAALETEPLVERSETISQDAINQARWLFHTNDPRRLRQGEARRTVIPVRLIDEGINTFATRSLKARGALVLGEEKAEIRLSRRLPLPFSRKFLNLRATIKGGSSEPVFSSAAIGRLPIPAPLFQTLVDGTIRAAGFGKEWTLARQAIRNLEFDPSRERVIVSYVWEPALLDHARAIAFAPADLARIRSAQTSLAALLDHHAPGQRIPLTQILSTMLDASGDDQRETRRAALLVLGIYLSEKNIATLIPEARNWPPLRPVTMMLAGRHDSAQHFVVSATLAAWAGEPIADAIGLYKELADARHGSGFSFADLAADRAGTRFGELLNQGSRRLDMLFKGEFRDHDLVPELADLPEAITATEFRRRFGDTNSPQYRQLSMEIERRLDALSLYQPE